MTSKSKPVASAPDAQGPLSAGSFSIWLSGTEAALQTATGGAEVPCGTCRGCCRSSMFIHIQPHETETLRSIPRALLFPAPGQPKGHVLMGYNDRGECPMLKGNDCSIYEHRPQTCRDYDCRIFAATGIAVDQETQPEIAERVKQWVFSYEDDAGREQPALVQKAAAFLMNNRDLFPPGALPSYPVQLAALAVRVYGLFAHQDAAPRAQPSAETNAEIAQAIIAVMGRPETPSLRDSSRSLGGVLHAEARG